MKQAVLFAFVGVLNTSIDFITYLVLTRWFGIGPVEANAVGFLAGALNSYVLNGKVTFRGAGTKLLRATPILRFALVTLAVLGMSTATMHSLLPLMPDLAAKTVAVFVTFVLGFLLNRTLVYCGTV